MTYFIPVTPAMLRKWRDANGREAPADMCQWIADLEALDHCIGGIGKWPPGIHAARTCVVIDRDLGIPGQLSAAVASDLRQSGFFGPV